MNDRSRFKKARDCSERRVSGECRRCAGLPIGLKTQTALNSAIVTTDLFGKDRSNRVFQAGHSPELSMRNLLTSFGLCAALGTAAPLLAQSPDPSVYEKDAATSRHMTAAEQRIYERAS